MTKKSKYTILIICEGENTEPLFFTSIIDAIALGIYDIGDVGIHIRPEIIDNEDNIVDQPRHKPIRKKRQTRNVIEDSDLVEGCIPLPLKWVIEGQKELKDGTYNEVWTVFDHDNHPARKEAFDAAEEEISGKRVQIAFSSISFELYLILHFVRFYKEFQTSECRDKHNSVKSKRKKIINCGTDAHPNDCHGDICIGGYARKNKFWTNTKKEESTFNLVKDKIEIGFENSAWLRYLSDQKESADKKIYDRNPYVTTDYLVKRLTNNIHKEWKWVSINEDFHINGSLVTISSGRKIIITNNSQSTILIEKKSICKVLSNNKREYFGSRTIINPNSIHEFDISKHISNRGNEWFIFHFNENYLMFEFC